MVMVVQLQDSKVSVRTGQALCCTTETTNKASPQQSALPSPSNPPPPYTLNAPRLWRDFLRSVLSLTRGRLPLGALDSVDHLLRC